MPSASGVGAAVSQGGSLNVQGDGTAGRLVASRRSGCVAHLDDTGESVDTSALRPPG